MHDRRHLTRVLRLASALFLFVFVIPAQDASARASEEALELRSLAAKFAATIDRMHGKAKRALVTAAQDKAFEDYFHAHDPGERAHLRARIDQISLSVQSRFEVEEMCLIDPGGAEISRIVGQEIADDLATNEADAIFFSPGFSIPPKKVHISEIYLSPDAGKWVLGYVTPVVVGDEKKAILHYEHSLGVFAGILRRLPIRDGTVVLIVTRGGHTIYDSRRTIDINSIGGKETADGYFERFSIDGRDIHELRAALAGSALEGHGRLSTASDDLLIAYRAVESWTVVVYRPADET